MEISVSCPLVESSDRHDFFIEGDSFLIDEGRIEVFGRTRRSERWLSDDASSNPSKYETLSCSARLFSRDLLAGGNKGEFSRLVKCRFLECS